MQFLLSEKEYKELLESKDRAAKQSTDVLQDLCTKVADPMPVRWTWGDGKLNPKPWGCTITAIENEAEWCCDECPVQNVCPNENKEWSK